jgi:hypothetical protein
VLRKQQDVINAQSFADWRAVPEDQWASWRGASVTTLLEPLLGHAPESLEGRPDITIRIEKKLWRKTSFKGVRPGRRITFEPFIAVSITRHGLADDSVQGDRHFVAVLQDIDGWKVDKLWSQQMCARGENAGQWTSAPCQ